MKKLIAIALFSIIGIGISQGQASAWWEHLCCKHKCCLTICCRQYNAFSPFCCDGACGYMPFNPACGQGGCGVGCSYPAGSCCPGELPAATEAGKTAVNNVPGFGAPQQVAPAPLPSAGAPANPAQGFGAYGAGSAYPSGVPAYNSGFTGYMPWNNGGR